MDTGKLITGSAVVGYIPAQRWISRPIRPSATAALYAAERDCRGAL